MYSESLLVIALLVALCALAVYMAAFVTYHISRSELFDRKQKILIVGFAWIVPIVGPAIVVAAFNEEIGRRKKGGVPLLEYLFLSATVGAMQGTSTDQEHIETIDTHHQDD
jgi:hypothetical protein